MKAKFLSLAKDLIRKTPTSQGRDCTLLCLWNTACASPASPQCKYSAICWKRGKKYVLCLHNRYSWSLEMLGLTHSWILKSLSEEIQPTTTWGLILSPWDLTAQEQESSPCLGMWQRKHWQKRFQQIDLYCTLTRWALCGFFWSLGFLFPVVTLGSFFFFFIEYEEKN